MHLFTRKKKKKKKKEFNKFRSIISFAIVIIGEKVTTTTVKSLPSQSIPQALRLSTRTVHRSNRPFASICRPSLPSLLKERSIALRFRQNGRACTMYVIPRDVIKLLDKLTIFNPSPGLAGCSVKPSQIKRRQSSFSSLQCRSSSSIVELFSSRCFMFFASTSHRKLLPRNISLIVGFSLSDETV